MSGSKILIVDDEDKILKYLEVELTNEGYQVFKAASGKESVEKVGEVDPSMIFMDILLPDMNGADAVKQIRGNLKGREIPVVFLTGVVTKNEEAQARLGINVDGQWFPAIAKPFKSEDILRAAKKALETL